MSKVIKVVDKDLSKNNLKSIDRNMRKKEEIERQQKITYLLELIKNNPDITEEMVRPDLKKYLGIDLFNNKIIRLKLTEIKENIGP